MDEIILRQRDAAKPLTGKDFCLNIALIILKLSAAQIVINLLTGGAGMSLLYIAFYLYAVWLLVGFLCRTVACHVYTLRENAIVLERCLGDSPIRTIGIPLQSVVSMRPVRKGERFRTTYRRVTEIDPACRQPFRMRAAFVLSLLSAHLARRCAGSSIGEENGYVLVFSEGEKLSACVFCPNDGLRDRLATMLGDAYSFDERMTRARVTTLYARALQRAFPALYPYVDPLTSEDEAAWAKEELARRKAEKQQKKQEKQKKTGTCTKPVNGNAQKTTEGAPAEAAAAPKKNRRRKQG